MYRQAKNADRCGGFLVSILICAVVAAIGFVALQSVDDLPRVVLSPAEVAELWVEQGAAAEPWPGSDPVAVR